MQSQRDAVDSIQIRLVTRLPCLASHFLELTQASHQRLSMKPFPGSPHAPPMLPEVGSDLYWIEVLWQIGRRPAPSRHEAIPLTLEDEGLYSVFRPIYPCL